MTFLFLAVAIIAEVSATLSLRMATHHGRKWIVPVVISYGVAFAGLTLTLQSGLTIGVAYGIWAACGVALTAVASRLFFKEPFTWIMAAGIVLIGAGVLLVELGGAH